MLTELGDYVRWAYTTFATLSSECPEEVCEAFSGWYATTPPPRARRNEEEWLVLPQEVFVPPVEEAELLAPRTQRPPQRYTEECYVANE